MTQVQFSQQRESWYDCKLLCRPGRQTADADHHGCPDLRGQKSGMRSHVLTGGGQTGSWQVGYARVVMVGWGLLQTMLCFATPIGETRNRGGGGGGGGGGEDTEIEAGQRQRRMPTQRYVCAVLA